VINVETRAIKRIDFPKYWHRANCRRLLYRTRSASRPRSATCPRMRRFRQSRSICSFLGRAARPQFVLNSFSCLRSAAHRSAANKRLPRHVAFAPIRECRSRGINPALDRTQQISVSPAFASEPGAVLCFASVVIVFLHVTRYAVKTNAQSRKPFHSRPLDRNRAKS